MTVLAEYTARFGSLPGWFTEESAAVWDCILAFQKSHNISGHAFEIGVYHGKSATLVCLHLDAQEKLVLVDPYRLDQVQALLQEIKKENVLYLSCKSSQLDRTGLADLWARCRWIHIDGEHTGFACTHDLVLADQLLAERGVVIVDDFMSARRPQVSAAVFNYMQAHPFSFRMFLCGFQKAYLARPNHAGEYLAFIRDRLAADLRERGFGERISFYKTTLPDDYNCFGMNLYDGQEMTGLDWDKSRIYI